MSALDDQTLETIRDIVAGLGQLWAILDVVARDEDSDAVGGAARLTVHLTDRLDKLTVRS